MKSLTDSHLLKPNILRKTEFHHACIQFRGLFRFIILLTSFVKVRPILDSINCSDEFQYRLQSSEKDDIQNAWKQKKCALKSIIIRPMSWVLLEIPILFNTAQKGVWQQKHGSRQRVFHFKQEFYSIRPSVITAVSWSIQLTKIVHKSLHT